MSYIKNCNKCGQRISLREMQNGQWVAFDAGTDQIHKHNKRSKANTVNYPKGGANDFEVNENKTNYNFIFIIALIVLAIWFFS